MFNSKLLNYQRVNLKRFELKKPFPSYAMLAVDFHNARLTGSSFWISCKWVWYLQFMAMLWKKTRSITGFVVPCD